MMRSRTPSTARFASRCDVSTTRSSSWHALDDHAQHLLHQIGVQARAAQEQPLELRPRLAQEGAGGQAAPAFGALAEHALQAPIVGLGPVDLVAGELAAGSARAASSGSRRAARAGCGCRPAAACRAARPSARRRTRACAAPASPRTRGASAPSAAARPRRSRRSPRWGGSARTSGRGAARSPGWRAAGGRCRGSAATPGRRPFATPCAGAGGRRCRARGRSRGAGCGSSQVEFPPSTSCIRRRSSRISRGCDHVERHREPGHAVGREPLLRQPDVRLEADPALLEVPLDLLDVALDDGAAQLQPEVAEAEAEQLLVREARPRGLGGRGRGERPFFFSWSEPALRGIVFDQRGIADRAVPSRSGRSELRFPPTALARPRRPDRSPLRCCSSAATGAASRHALVVVVDHGVLADLRRGVDPPLAQRPHQLGGIPPVDRDGDDGAALPAAVEHAHAVDRARARARNRSASARARSRISSRPIAVA